MNADGPAPNPPLLKLTGTLALAALHVALFWVSMAPLDFWPAALLAVAPLAWISVHAKSTRLVLGAVFVTQFILWLWLGRWLIAVTAVGYPLYAVYMSSYALLFVWIMRRGLALSCLAARPWTLAMAVVWVGLEAVQGKIVFYGYPWYLLGHPLNEWSILAQSADIWGAYGVSFLAVLASGVLVDGWRCRRGVLPRRALLITVAWVVTLQVANIAYGTWRVSQTDQLTTGPQTVVIQTNVPQDNKTGWTREAQRQDFESFCELSLEAVLTRDTPPDLVVWPETMLPGFGLEAQAIDFITRNRYSPGDFFSTGVVALRDELGAPILVGSPVYINLRVDGSQFAWDENYNSAYLIQGDPPYDRYDKHLLTPFGEVMPYVSAWPWLEQKLLSIGAGGMSFTLDQSPTVRRLNLEVGGTIVRLATPICFEVTIPRVCRAMIWDAGEKKADLFVNLSNDGWFNIDGAGRRQHLHAARFRCIENRVPMIRAVNTGLSVAIDSTGKVVGSVGPGRYGEHGSAGWLAATPRIDARRTVYGRVGDAWAWICLGLTLAFVIAPSIGGRRQTED